MTRMIFFPGEGSLVVMDTPVPAEELTRAVNAGDWSLPAPYTFLNPEVNSGAFLQAVCLNQIVVVTLTQPIMVTTEHLPSMVEPLVISARQQQVLLALSEGLTTKEIARRLQIGERMVHYHIARIKKSFGSLTRAQSVGKAASLGLYRPRMRSRNDVHKDDK